MTKSNFLYVLPLLTLLSVSPTEVLKHKPSRSLASVEVESEKPEIVEEKKEFPKFQEMISQVDQSNLLISQEVTKESIKEKSVSLTESLTKEKESFNKEATDKEEIEKQRISLESLVVDAVIFDKEIDVLDQKQELDEESKKELLLSSVSHKEILELLLTDLEKNEELLDTPKIPEIAEVPKDDKKEEEEKKDEPTKIASEEKKEDKKEEEICEASEQVKVLTAQVEKLMDQQNLILQAMLNLTQTMSNMSQNMQQQQPYFPIPQTAYQYNAPMAQGNWVYYPQGFNPQQMAPSYYPAQSHQPMQQQQQQSNMWNMQPSQNLQFQPQEQMPVGQFGMSNNLMSGTGYNMGQFPII